MINANETNLAAIDVLDGGLSKEEIHKVSLCHGTHKIWRWNGIEKHYNSQEISFIKALFTINPQENNICNRVNS
jgi:hypothetical protein